ncbi:MAG: hypothetical protein GY819_13535 [Planctomycetaceae bacterium]|nr:hypothetical protein [Planctomycetaceae bacterium]MCP4463812.1 hypothetical protein [Planctomycetaceae bacterium]
MLGWIFTLLLIAVTVAAPLLGYGSAQIIPMQYVFYGTVVIWLLVVIIQRIVMQSIPKKCTMVAFDGSLLNPSAFSIEGRLLRQDFATISNPMLNNSRPPVAMLAMRHNQGSCFAAIYNPVTKQDLLGTDLVSVLNFMDENGTHEILLTTGCLAEGGTIPFSADCLIQLFPNANVDTLLKEHWRAVDLLKQKGLRLQSVKKSNFQPLLQNVSNRARSNFFANPVWNALIVTMRSLTNQSPYLGPLAHQTGALKKLDSMMPEKGDSA